jgi:hypothetical protein
LFAAAFVFLAFAGPGFLRFGASGFGRHLIKY